MGVDFDPFGFDGVFIEELGLYEFRFVFSFGGLLDSLTGRLLELAEVGDNTVSWLFGGAIRFHQRPVREFFPVRFFRAWFDQYAGIVTKKSPLSKKLFLTTSLLGKKEARIRHFSLVWRRSDTQNAIFSPKDHKFFSKLFQNGTDCRTWGSCRPSGGRLAIADWNPVNGPCRLPPPQSPGGRLPTLLICLQ